MIEDLKICQHNAARGRDILYSLFEISLKEQADLIFIQEPYVF